MLVKGLNLRERVEKLSWLCEYPHFIEIDYERFDMTISRDILKCVERAFLTWPYPAHEHPLLHQCLKLAETTNGVSDHGLRYFTDGGRCSGDAHTSIANGLLNSFLTWVCNCELPPDAYRSVHEGDDGLIAVKSEYLSQVLYNLTFLQQLGFRTKVGVYDQIEDTTFCGRYFVNTPYGMEDMCDLLRTLSKIHITTSQLALKPLLLAKCLSYFHTDGATPVVGALCRMVIKVLRKDPEAIRPRLLRKAVFATVRERWILNDTPPEKLSVNVDLTPRRISAEKRALVARRCGIGFQTQLSIEQYFDRCADAGIIPEVYPRILVDALYHKPGVVLHGDIFSCTAHVDPRDD